MKKSIFKRVAASAAAMTLALVGVVALGSKAEVKAQDLVDAPVGENITENVLSQMLASEKSLDAWGSQWVQCYDEGIASWLESSNTYLKVTLKNVGTYTGDDGSATSVEDIFAYWGDVSGWFKYLIVDEANYFPVDGATSDSAYVYVPMSNFDLNEDNGIGFNVQAGHISMTVTAVEIVEDVEYYVAGPITGKEWDAEGRLMEKNADGTYSVTFTDIAAGTYEFKVTDGTWYNTWNLDGNANNGEGNAWVDVDEDDSTVVITFDGERVSVEVNPAAEDPEDPEDPATEEPESPSTGETVEYADYFGAQVYAMDNADWKWNSVSVDEFAADGTIVLTGNAADIAAGSGSGAIGATGIQFFVGEQGQTDLGDKTISAKIAYVLKDEEGNVVEEGEVTIDTSKVDDAGKTVLIADVPLQGYGADWSEFTALGNFTLTATVSDIVITDPNAEEPNNGTPDLGDGVHAALIIALAFAALAVVATAAGKKFTADEK